MAALTLTSVPYNAQTRRGGALRRDSARLIRARASGGGACSGAMSGDLGPVAAGSHVAPATPSGGGAIDEEPATGVVGADPETLEVVVGEVVRQ